MTANEYFDISVQKAFLPTTPGCTEHHLKLATILGDARKKHKSLAVCWLDLANAYGSVHHTLISFALKHYSAPPQFRAIVQAFYTGLQARVTSGETPLIPLKVGVYQGDPLSVVIFNTVINTMIDTVQTRQDLGYKFSPKQRPINLLQYADDSCLVADSPASCQYLLDMVARWLSWSGMKAKIPKCASLALQSSSSKTIDPGLLLDGQLVPFASQPVKFLGMRVEIPPNHATSKTVVVSELSCMLSSIDTCPLTRKQKLLLYKAGVCPRLSWLLTIEQFPISWVQKHVDSLATSFLKKWAGLARPANTALLHLPTKIGGLNLPQLSTLHKKLQVSRQAQLLTSRDPGVRHMAEKNLQKDLALSRPKFRASEVVRDVMVTDPGMPRKRLSTAAKKIVQDDDHQQMLQGLQGLERQGHMSRCSSPESAQIWAEALKMLTDEQFKFALNSAVDTLPHNLNLCLWNKRENAACTLCGDDQSLIHVLNICRVARDERRFNSRHDAVLREIVALISAYLPPSVSISSDLGSYSFPQHIVSTDLRPDVVWWDDETRKLCLLELTVCFETSFEEAAQRKKIRYADIVDQARLSHYISKLITVEVGARGIVNMEGLKQLQDELNVTKSDMSKLLITLVKTVIVESHKIWCRRNTP